MDKKTTEKLKTFHEVNQLFGQSENYTPSILYYPSIHPYILIWLLYSLKTEQDQSKTRRLTCLTSQYFFIICPYWWQNMHFWKQIADLNLVGYNMEHTATELSAGGVLLYISQNFFHKHVKNYKFIVPKNLNQCLLLVITFSSKQIRLYCTRIYKHPSVQHYKFNNDFLENLLNRIKLKKSLVY